MATEKFDVVVIGAGLGGLSAAGYMAKAGKKVLVLEHHTVPGGYAHEFRRGKYRFEVALHALDGAGPGGWSYETLKDLGVLDRVHFHQLDPFYTVRFPDYEINAWADPLMYEAELIRHFPHEAKGIRGLIDAMVRVFYDTRRYQEDGKLDIRPPVEKMPGQYPNMLTAMGMSWEEFVAQHIKDHQLKGVFTTLWGYFGLPPGRLNAAIFSLAWVSYHVFGAYYPKGGSMAISRALEAFIKECGGEVRYRQTVNKIDIQNGKAIAVETEKGLRVEADVVISNANAPDMMLKFVGRGNLPEDYIEKVESPANSLSSLVVYLGLERDLRAEGWDYHELFVSDTYDIEQDYASVMAGSFEKSGMVIAHYTHVDRAAAPEGKSVLSITTLAPWDYGNQWGTGGNMENYRQNPQYLELKQDAADKLIDRVEKLLPGLRDSIKYIEVGTPLTNRRYSRNPGGAIYGSEQTVENMFLGRLHEKTPIENLFLTGAWVSGGGMSMAMLSGRSVAGRVKAYMDGTKAVSLLGLSEIDDLPLKVAAPSATLPSPQGKAPSVTLTATGSEREVTLDALNIPAVLIFHGQDTADVAGKVNRAIRAEYAKASNVFIANIVNLQSVPRMFRSVARRALKQSYEQSANRLPEGARAKDFVVILPDWDGSVARTFEMENLGETVGVSILDAAGNIIEVFRGEDVAKDAIDVLASMNL